MQVQGGKMGSDAERFSLPNQQYEEGCRCGSCFTEVTGGMGGAVEMEQWKRSRRKSDRLQRGAGGWGEGIPTGFQYNVARRGCLQEVHRERTSDLIERSTPCCSLTINMEPIVVLL
jgi:hypothetical protein